MISSPFLIVLNEEVVPLSHEWVVDGSKNFYSTILYETCVLVVQSLHGVGEVCHKNSTRLFGMGFVLAGLLGKKSSHIEI